MSHFFWQSGHLGWCFYALAVFTGIWVLVSDLVWRLKNAPLRRVASWMCVGWLLGAALIVALARPG